VGYIRRRRRLHFQGGKGVPNAKFKHTQPSEQ